MELVREDQMSHKTNIRGRECGTDGIDEEKTRRNMCARQTAVWGAVLYVKAMMTGVVLIVVGS